MKATVIIPFRDRGLDLHRAANLEVVQAWWYAHGFEPQIWDDGLTGDAQFNRHLAYNRAVSGNPSTSVFVFTEADMLIHPRQIKLATQYAADTPGLVVPFLQYRYLSELATTLLRDDFHDRPTGEIASRWSAHPSDSWSVFSIQPESVMDNGRSIGAVNVVSAKTLDITGGFTEVTCGNWYDDRIIEEGFAFLTQPTRFVSGPAVHLYHLPGWTGDHLTEEDRRATEANKAALLELRGYIRHRDKAAVRSMLATRKGDASWRLHNE